MIDDTLVCTVNCNIVKQYCPLNRNGRAISQNIDHKLFFYSPYFIYPLFIFLGYLSIRSFCVEAGRVVEGVESMDNETF